jgi:hypothetical protein
MLVSVFSVQDYQLVSLTSSAVSVLVLLVLVVPLLMLRLPQPSSRFSLLKSSVLPLVSLVLSLVSFKLARLSSLHIDELHQTYIYISLKELDYTYYFKLNINLTMVTQGSMHSLLLLLVHRWSEVHSKVGL